MGMKRIFSLLVILTMIFSSYTAIIHAVPEHEFRNNQHEIRWAKSYTAIDSGFLSVRQTRDGGYVAAGTANMNPHLGQAWVVRLDSTGRVIWQHYYKSADEPFSIISSVEQTTDGGYVVTGQVFLHISGAIQAWIIKLDSAGNIVWQRAYGRQMVITVGETVRPTSDGGYVVVGWTYEFGPGKENAWVLKLDYYGNIVWERAIGQELGRTAAFSIEETVDGYVVAGGTGQFPDAITQPALFKLDLTGNLLWQRGYDTPGPVSVFYSVRKTLDGGFVATGPSPLGHVWVLKVSNVGSIMWQYDYRFYYGSTPRSLEMTDDGGYIIGGDSALVAKLNTTGSVIWSRSFEGAGAGAIFSIGRTKDGGYVGAGHVFLPQLCCNYVASGLLLKLDSGGLCCSGITLQNNVTVTSTFATAVTSGLTALKSNATITVTVSAPTNSVAIVAVQCTVQHQNSNHDNHDDSDNGKSPDHDRESEARGGDSHYNLRSYRPS